MKKSETDETSYLLSQDSESSNSNINNVVTVNKWEVIPSLWTGAFLAALDGTIVTAIYPVIGGDFQQSDKASWVATLYMLSSSALQPLYGGLSDMFGRKPMLLIANIIFLIGSFGCFLAQNITQLFIARIIAGVGGAGLGTLSSIIVSDMVSLRERSTYNGMANLVYGTGQVVGAPIGGYLADKVGWRYAFLIQCPITLISIIVIHFRVKLPHHNKTVGWRDIDISGSIFLITAITLILVALQLATNQLPMKYPVLVFTGSLVSFFIVWRTELKAKNPIILIKVLTTRNPLLSGLTNFFGYMGYFAISFNLPLLLQVVYDETASKAGSRLITSIVAMCIGSLSAGYITRRTGNYYYVCLCGVGSEILGSLLLTTFLDSTQGWQFQTYLFPSGLGHGLILSGTLMAIVSSIEKTDQAKAISMSYLFRVLGGSFGITLTSIYNNFMVARVLSDKLSGVTNRNQIITKVTKSVAEINSLPEPIRVIVKNLFALVIHRSFTCVVIIECLLMVFASGIKQFSLDK